jgi:hypothetical protein
VTDKDWVKWHQAYDEPDSSLSRRLVVVRDRIRDALDGFPPGPVRLVSVCAGQGRDLFGVLPDHPRRADISGRLVELDPDNARVASATARAVGVAADVLVADAGITDSYAGAVPADLVLVCGLFGNITDPDVARTVSFLPQLCAPGTRGRWHPDLFPTVCEWLAAAGFSELWVSDPNENFGVGVHRYGGGPVPLSRGERMFTFIGHARLATA